MVPSETPNFPDTVVLGAWAFSFPLLIGLSCLFTKQHYVIDVPAGAALGWVTFEVYRFLV